MYQPEIETICEMFFGTVATAFLIRFAIRTWYREKNKHLHRLMESQDNEQEQEKEN